jgi:hypothetical protein
MTGITAALIGGGLSLAGGLGSAFLSGQRGSQQQTAQQTFQPPSWFDTASQSAFDLAKNTSANLAPPTALQIAPIGQQEQTAIQDLYNLGANRYGAQNWLSAQNTAQGVAGYNPQQIGAPSAGDIKQYMDPYINAVLDPALAQVEQGRALGHNQIADAANRVGSFAGSGSRAQVAGGALDAQTNLLRGQLAGQLNSAGFTQALAAARQAQLANQQAGLLGQGLNLQGAGALGQLTAGGQDALSRGFLGGIGGQQILRQQEQTQNAASKAYADALRQQPLDQLQIQLAALSALRPQGGTSTSVQTGPGPTSNPFLSGIGGASATAGLLGSLWQGFGNPFLGGGQAPGSGWIA